MDNSHKSRIPGFYNWDIKKRQEAIAEKAGLTEQEIEDLTNEPLKIEMADRFTENVIGVFGTPFGVGLNCRVNAKDYLIPMVLEESSVVAAMSNVAKIVRDFGYIKTSSSEAEMIGQVQIVGLTDFEQAKKAIMEHKDEILEIANDQDRALVSFGGGARDIELREIDTVRGKMLIMHLIVNVADAMGANAVNTMLEAITPAVERHTKGRILLRIISNYAVKRLARAELFLRKEGLKKKGFSSEDVVENLLDAWAFAKADPYRAATHNKGILNGIGAVILATGNDWRAVDSACHSYASRDGKYTALSDYSKDDDGNLHGVLECPMPVGTIGGVTKLHPGVKIALKILNVSSSRELSEVIVAVGLLQNLAAMIALATDGLQRGHMKLHAKNLALQAGGAGIIEEVAERLTSSGKITFDHAKEIVNEIRGSKSDS